MPEKTADEPNPETYDRFVAGEDDDGRRLDRLVRRLLPDLPLSAVYRAIRERSILLNGARAGPADRVHAGDPIAIRKGFHGSGRPQVRIVNSRLIPNIADLIVYEDRHLLFLNKPAGIQVHGDGGLGPSVSAYLAPRLKPSLSFRPGPLHRLDTNTSGLLCFSASLAGSKFFTAALARGALRKEYLAVVEGRVAENAIWEDELCRDSDRGVTRVAAADGTLVSLGKAVTSVEPIGRNGDLTLLRVIIGTGRTHQIRAQAGHRDFPLAGDRKYGSASLSPGSGAPYLLHALRISFGEGYPGLPGEIAAPLPGYFLAVVRELFGYLA